MNDYYTVTEYADVVGKDVGNIRRMLLNGTLKGEKLGRQWIIPKDTVYPDDKRIKSGDYCNWRKASSIRKEYPELMKSLNKMCHQLSEIYGDRLEKVIMYGSYVRGEQTSESDVDIAVILKEDDETRHDKMTDIVVDLELDLGVVLSVVPIDCREYAMWRRTLPFFINIAKEGIVLWKAA